ncbi:MAG: hypothetical protein ABFD89_04770 [Bryobacteraceae bacterium]
MLLIIGGGCLLLFCGCAYWLATVRIGRAVSDLHLHQEKFEDLFSQVSAMVISWNTEYRDYLEKDFVPKDCFDATNAALESSRAEIARTQNSLNFQIEQAVSSKLRRIGELERQETLLLNKLRLANEKLLAVNDSPPKKKAPKKSPSPPKSARTKKVG